MLRIPTVHRLSLFPLVTFSYYSFHSLAHIPSYSVFCAWLLLMTVFFSLTMDLTQEYAVAAGGIFFLFFIAKLIPHVMPLIEYISESASKHLTYPYLLNRHRYLGPWSRAHVLVQVIYITTNVFCLIFENPFSRLSFKILTVTKAGLRAGTMSLVNMIPLFAGPRFGLLADCLGMSLMTVRRIHRSAGIMSLAHAVFHVLVYLAARPSFALSLPKNLFAAIVSVLSLPLAHILT